MERHGDWEGKGVGDANFSFYCMLGEFRMYGFHIYARGGVFTGVVYFVGWDVGASSSEMGGIRISMMW